MREIKEEEGGGNGEGKKEEVKIIVANFPKLKTGVDHTH